MKTYVIMGAMIGIAVGLVASLLGVQMNIWLPLGTGVATALIAGKIKSKK